MLLPVLRDIVRYTSLNFIEIVKVTGSEEETKIESMSIKDSVVLKAKLHKPEPELAGEFGMNSLQVLRGYAEMVSMRADDASVSVRKRMRQDREVPESIIFRDAHGTTLNYRLMGAEVVPDQPIQININWDIAFEPSKSKIDEFNKLAQILGGIHKDFTPTIEDGTLFLNIGDNSAVHSGAFAFADEIDGRLRGEASWSIGTLLSILKLAEQAQRTEMRIDSDGLLGVTLDSGFAEYTYLIAGKVPH